MRKISEESVKLIREHLSELDLTFPLTDDDSGLKILDFFESLDDHIGGLRMEGKVVDRKFIDDVGRGMDEFMISDEDIDYEDLERRLKAD